MLKIHAINMQYASDICEVKWTIDDNLYKLTSFSIEQLRYHTKYTTGALD